MRTIILKICLFAALILAFGTLTNCAKSGCPANESLYKESMGEAGGKSSKKSSKNKSGVLIPEGKAGKKY
ncbi:MAG: hypothetical protein R2730_04055 [Chitinophagales bacterium]